MEAVDSGQIGRLFREESGRSLATLIRVLGDIDLAEDAVQDAFAIALRRWPADGLPPNPGGRITTTARNCAIDRLRRESRGRELLGELGALASGDDEVDTPKGEAGPVHDSLRLRLIFTCCHPALAAEAQVGAHPATAWWPLDRGGRTSLPGRRADNGEAARRERSERSRQARIPYRVPADLTTCQPGFHALLLGDLT